MQDILVLLVPHLSEKDAQLVFDLSLQPEVLKNRDNGVQKRAYKLLTKITQSGKIKPDAEALFAQLDEVAEETLAAAKKVSFPNFSRTLFIKIVLGPAQSVQCSLGIPPLNSFTRHSVNYPGDSIGHEGAI